MRVYMNTYPPWKWRYATRREWTCFVVFSWEYIPFYTVKEAQYTSSNSWDTHDFHFPSQVPFLARRVKYSFFGRIADTSLSNSLEVISVTFVIFTLSVTRIGNLWPQVSRLTGKSSSLVVWWYCPERYWEDVCCNDTWVPEIMCEMPLATQAAWRRLLLSLSVVLYVVSGKFIVCGGFEAPLHG